MASSLPMQHVIKWVELMRDYTAMFLKGSLCLLMLITSANAWAVCALTDGRVKIAPKTVNIPSATFTVQRDMAVGGLIGTVPVSIVGGSDKTLFLCNAKGDSFYYQMLLFPNKSSLNGFYDTNLAGVGIQMGTFANPMTRHPAEKAGPHEDITIRTIEFRKTGRITPGVTTAGLLSQIKVSDRVTVAVSYNIASFTINQVACSIKTPTLTFPIGNISMAAFAAAGANVGATPPESERTQNLGLDCDPDANINVELQGAQNPDVATPSVLALTGQGNSDVAGGVGVQVLYRDVPLELNQRIVLKRSSGGLETFPIKVRYYQTKPTVTTGKANASATLNLTYQ